MLNKRKHGSVHHIIATSIGGPRISQNTYIIWPKEKHIAYHELFYNYLPSITIRIIKGWTGRDGNLVPQKMGERTMWAWKTLFGAATPAEAIVFIRQNFLPVEKMFLSGQLWRGKP